MFVHNYLGHIFLDDERHPWDVTWTGIDYTTLNWWIVRNYEGFVDAVTAYFPTTISIDNDLQTEKEGIDCLRWLIDYCLDNDFELPQVIVHSKNTVAKESMDNLVNNFKNRVR